MTRGRMSAAIAFMALLGPVAVRAQGADAFIIPPGELPDMRHCTDTLARANVSRLTVYQETFLRDTASAMVAQVDLIAQRIAATIRTALGGRGAGVPAGDSLGMWQPQRRALPFVVVVHRSGASTWRIDSAAGPVKGKLVDVYARALAAIPPDSLWMVWPDDYKPDSFEIRFGLLGASRVQQEPRETSLFALYSANGIAETPAVESHVAKPHFPDDAGLDKVSGRVELAFIVDTSGYADPATVRVLEPTEDLLTASTFAHFYREFVQVTRDLVVRDRFTPAHVGSCAVKQWFVLWWAYDGRRLEKP